MTKIDFYILSDTNKQAENLFACKLIEKIYSIGHQIFIYCEHQAQAFAIDEQLWSFEPSSFIPHNLQGEGPQKPPAVQIGFTAPDAYYHDILINLSQHVPAFYHQFKRICEIIPHQEEIKQAKRENFRFYQKKSLKIQTHSI